MAKEYEFALENQQNRIQKLIKETEEKVHKKKRKGKKRAYSEDPRKAKIQQEIEKKIKELAKNKNILPALSNNN